MGKSSKYALFCSEDGKKQKDENNQQKMYDQAVELAVFYYRGNKFKNEIKRETTAPWFSLAWVPGHHRGFTFRASTSNSQMGDSEEMNGIDYTKTLDITNH